MGLLQDPEQLEKKLDRLNLQVNLIFQVPRICLCRSLDRLYKYVIYRLFFNFIAVMIGLGIETSIGAKAPLLATLKLTTS